MKPQVNQLPINAYFAGAWHGNAKWWTWFAVAVIGLLFWLLGQIVFGAGLIYTAKLTDPAGSEAFWETVKSTGPSPNEWIARSPIAYMFVLLMYPPIMIGLWISVKYIQKRTVLSLQTAAKKFRWKRLFFAMIVFWTIAGTLSIAAHFSGINEAKFVFDPTRFWLFLPVTLLFIPLQSASEEIVFRGFLNQGIGKYIKNPWLVFTLSSAAFAALHMTNPEVAEATKEHSLIYALRGYFIFGMLLCVLTYIDGGLETAIGVHAANNIFAASVVGYEHSALPIPTIFHVGLDVELDMIISFIGLTLLCAIMYKTRKPL